MDWDIKDLKRVYDGHFKVDEFILQHDLFEGGQSNELLRERVSRENSVAVLPYDPIRDEVVLVEQLRIGALDNDANPWLIEVIAGLVEKGEKIEDVAIRESKEEANCILSNLYHVSSFYPSPGGFCEMSHVFIAKTDTSNTGGVHGEMHEGEDIKVHVVSSKEALNLLDQGIIRSAIPMIALFRFRQLREQLQKDWA